MPGQNFAPSKHTRTDVQIGLTVADQRTGEFRRTIYADEHVVLVRDETGSTTLARRGTLLAVAGSAPTNGTA